MIGKFSGQSLSKILFRSNCFKTRYKLLTFSTVHRSVESYLCELWDQMTAAAEQPAATIIKRQHLPITRKVGTRKGLVKKQIEARIVSIRTCKYGSNVPQFDP